MPRDASGNYTLPEAPFQPATVAQSARVNHNFSDIAAALSDSYSVSLGQPMQGDLQMNGHQILGIGGDLAPTGDVNAGGNVTAGGNTITVGTNTTLSPELILNGAAGTNVQIRGQTAGKSRWLVVPGDASTETPGTNAGSNFAILRYADDGTTALGVPLSIIRATGAVSVAQTLAANGGLTTTTVTASGAVTAASATVTNGITVGSLGVTGNATVTGTFGSGGAITAPSAQINGNINAASVAVSGAVTAVSAGISGNLTVTSRIQAASLHAYIASGSGGFVGSWQGDNSNVGFWNNTSTIYWGNADGNDVPQQANARMSLDASSNLYAVGSITAGAEVHAGGRGVYYDGIGGGGHAVGFYWTGPGLRLNVYVDGNYIGQMVTSALAEDEPTLLPHYDDLAATVAVQTSRLDGLEARIAALEAARP